MNEEHLEAIAVGYHLDNAVEDKFIEDISQYFFCDWVKETFEETSRVCEMGYGEGITAAQLSDYFSSYDIIEGASSLCQKAECELENAKVLHCLFEDYSPAKKYDLVLALHVLEHVDKPQEILKVIESWLNPGGVVVILVPNKNSLHRVFARGMNLISSLDELSERDIQVGHQRVYGLDELHAEVIEAGFEVTEERGFFLKSLPNSMMIDHDPKLILEQNKISSELPANLLANICVVCRFAERESAQLASSDTQGIAN